MTPWDEDLAIVGLVSDISFVRFSTNYNVDATSEIVLFDYIACHRKDRLFILCVGGGIIFLMVCRPDSWFGNSWSI